MNCVLKFSNMPLKYLLTVLFLLNICAVKAQRLGVKVEISEIIFQRYGLHLSWKTTRNASTELWGRFGRFSLPANLYNGEIRVHYTQRQLIWYRPGTGQLLGWKDWEYLGTATALDPVSDHVPSGFIQLGLGQVFRGTFKKTIWRWYSGPGFTLTRCAFYLVKDEFTIAHDTTLYHLEGVYPNLAVYNDRRVEYEQDRKMEKMSRWTGGIHYGMGIQRVLRRHLALEASVSAGWNLMLTYEALKLPSMLNRWWVQPMISLNWNW